MEYENKSDKAFAKKDKHIYKAGARAIAGENVFSAFEASADAGAGKGELGVEAEAGARVHAFQFGSDDSENMKLKARFLGADVGLKGGLDTSYVGAEVKARLTMSEVEAGPFKLHLGVGVSTGAKIEDKTIDVKYVGWGVKVGKRIGISAYDNEFSVELLGLFGKGWLWGK